MHELPLPALAGFIQFDVIPGAWQDNLATVRRLLALQRPAPSSLIVLPELWATGFAYGQLAELAAITPSLLAALQEEAAQYQCLLAGSLVEHDLVAQALYNTLFIVGPQGCLGRYRKQQLFSPMAEDSHFSPGDNPQPIATGLGPVACLVCYDLRFPDLARHQATAGAGVIVVSAQWPASRKDHWRTLLQARAIENQAFVVACNRCGSSGSLEFGGGSAVIDPNGCFLAEAGEQEEAGLVRLDPQVLSGVRQRFCSVGESPYRWPDQDKVVALPAAEQALAGLKAVGRRVVFTNGCFDILHQGHVTYLEAARRQGDCLVVGLNSDASIRAIKGPERPVNREESRARVLAALGCVDYVVIFGDETPLALVTALLPDVLVKGADWPVEKIVGAAEVFAHGGTVITIPMVEGCSTTGLIDLIRRRDRP